MNLVIVTGMSGAGKSSSLKFLEDMGFFCVDNLPPFLISKFLDSNLKRIAIGIDIRGGELFDDLFMNLEKLDSYKILFLDAADDVLIKRFKETRRIHPLAKNDRVITGISQERKILQEVKSKADYIIDTSYMRTNELKEKINDIFIAQKNLTV